MFRRLLLFALLLVLGCAPSVFAQNRPALQAHRVRSPISIDGRLNEAAWQEADSASGFRQFEPDEGAAATYPTEVRVLYGPGNLYIGAYLYDEQPARIRQTLGRRDDYNQADWFTVSIDSYYNQETAYTFAVNAAGVQLDGIRTGGGFRGLDTSWDAIWESDVRVTPEGWVVEMRIPYSVLRFSESSSTWGIHFVRRIPRLGEQSEWPLVPRTQRANLIAQFGRLTGLENIEPRRNLQVRPYVVSRLQTQERPRQPGELAYASNIDVGGDLKVGLSSNITLDVTLNPDFGQVEADPAVLNLTAFETFYEEKRPFFLEGAQIYQFSAGPGELLYTRRIGAQAPIVGAAKLSGRTAEGLAFGVLGASTGADFHPVRHYGVVRLSQQIGSYSSAGGILTGFSGPTTAGRRRSLVGGADWDFRLAGNRYGIEGFAAVTHRRWTQEGRTPETGFAGKLWWTKRQGVWTYNVGADVYSDEYNPNDVGRMRRNNFVALVGGFDYEVHGGQSFGPFQRASIGGFGLQRFSYREGINLGLSFDLRSRWTLRNFQQIELGLSVENPFGGYDLYETRGLGPWAKPFALEISGEFETDDRRRWQVEPEFSFTLRDDGGSGYGLGLRSNWNIGSRLTLSGNVEVEWENDMIAWSSNETFTRREDQWYIGTASLPPAELAPGAFEAFDDEGLLDPIFADVDPYTEGYYYVPVFGARDVRSFDFTLRSNITFTPGLSLQFYGQLFMARGRYDRFRILTNPDTLVPFESFPKRKAFAFSSFQANMVLRWEYLPGSTLYLVWTQGRRLSDRLNPLAPWGPSPYEVPVGGQFVDTFSIFPQNVFLVKIDYTFLY